MTKRELHIFLQHQLGHDFRWAINALNRIAANQTSIEIVNEETNNKNGVGFTGADAAILTSFWKFYGSRGYLSVKQTKILLMRMPKYAGQLMKQEYFSMDKLEAAAKKYKMVG